MEPPAEQGVSASARVGASWTAAHHAHDPAHQDDGSLCRTPCCGRIDRQRGVSSWELRVYAGTNPDTGKPRYRTATVVGNRGDAERGLAELVSSVRSERSIGSGSTVSELLEAWFVVASGSWAPTTIRKTRSVVDRYLHPQLGSMRVGELMSAFASGDAHAADVMRSIINKARGAA